MSRGKPFETQIEWKNKWYQKQGLGVVQKIPTPMVIVGSNFKEREKTKKGPMYFHCRYDKIRSTVDFVGWLDNISVCFEAKETKGHCFPLWKLKDHQKEFMISARQGGATCFLLVNFETHKQVYLLFIQDFVSFADSATRKSIPFSYFEVQGILLDNLDYIGALKQHYKQQ